MNTHRQSIRSRTRVFQACAVALLGGSAAAALLPVQKMLQPAGLTVTAPPPPVVAVAPAEAPPIADLDKVSQVLISVGPEIKPPPPPAVVAIAPEPEQPMAAAPVPSGQWVYVGSIITPTTRHALVKIDQDQHMFRPGQTHTDSTRIVAIDPSELTIEQGGLIKKIALQARTSDWPEATPGMPGMPGMPGGVSAKQGMPMKPMAGRSMPPGQTFDQMRAQAMADAARRAQMQAAQTMPNQEQPRYEREMVGKRLADPSMNEYDRATALRDLGLTPDMSPEAAMEWLRAQGIEASDGVMATIKQFSELYTKLPPDPIMAQHGLKPGSLTPAQMQAFRNLPDAQRSEFVKLKNSGELDQSPEILQKFQNQR